MPGNEAIPGILLIFIVRSTSTVMSRRSVADTDDGSFFPLIFERVIGGMMSMPRTTASGYAIAKPTAGAVSPGTIALALLSAGVAAPEPANIPAAIGPPKPKR